MTPETIITILVGLVLTAYGFIFKKIEKRIATIEERPRCRFKLDDRIIKLEETHKDLEPVLLQIQTHLARIETTLEFLKTERTNK